MYKRQVVDDVILEEGALKKLPEILNKEPYNQYKHLVMVCDDNTYEAAGKEVEKLLNGISVIKLDPENLHANEIGVAKVKELSLIHICLQCIFPHTKISFLIIY